jgi:hypothetical protein
MLGPHTEKIWIYGLSILNRSDNNWQNIKSILENHFNESKEQIEAAVFSKDHVGGPVTITHNEIAMTAFEVLGIEQKITYIPDWIRTSILKLVRIFTGSKTYGPIEFFLTVMAMDMIAPEYGNHTLKEYFTNMRSMNA